MQGVFSAPARPPKSTSSNAPLRRAATLKTLCIDRRALVIGFLYIILQNVFGQPGVTAPNVKNSTLGRLASAEYKQSARSPATKRAYGSDFRLFAAFGAARPGLRPCGAVNRTCKRAKIWQSSAYAVIGPNAYSWAIAVLCITSPAM
jgi:hypothetical protein